MVSMSSASARCQPLAVKRRRWAARSGVPARPLSGQPRLCIAPHAALGGRCSPCSFSFLMHVCYQVTTASASPHCLIKTLRRSAHSDAACRTRHRLSGAVPARNLSTRLPAQGNMAAHERSHPGALLEANCCLCSRVWGRASRLITIWRPNASSGRICSYTTHAAQGSSAPSRRTSASLASGAKYTSTHLCRCGPGIGYG